ncbi:MAG: TetR/AcrR family transcriptional regulator [Lachnospiraceae bacterium]
MNLDLQQFNTSEPNIDRRKRKTRIAIENALLDLMQYKPLNAITISELAQAADINRKTFYNNYNSVDDVIKGINEKLSQHIFNALPEKITINNEIEIYHLLLNFTTALEPHKKLLRKMTQASKNIPFFEYFEDQILPYVERNLLSYHVDTALTPYINSYLVNGLYSILLTWINEEHLNSEQVALLGYNLITASIKLDNYKDIHISSS